VCALTIIPTADEIPGREIESVIGIARGSVVRARFSGVIALPGYAI